MKPGNRINLFGTVATAGILLWSLSQNKPEPAYSPPYIQVQILPQASPRAILHVARKLPSATVETALHLVKDAAFEKSCRLRAYAAAAPKRTAYRSPAKDGGGNGNRPDRATVKATPLKTTPHLVKDVTFRKSCKLRDYAAIVPTENAHQSAANANEADADGPGPAEIKVTPNIQDVMNKIRPKQITGTITVEGKAYQFGSGGRGQSIPYGDYPITPDAVGSWGSRHGAIGVANGTIADPKLHRDRDGIELHAASNDSLQTHGCVAIRKDQWPEFRKQVLAMLRDNKKLYLHVSDQGASVSTNQLEFIGESIAAPTMRDVLSLLEAPTDKAAE